MALTSYSKNELKILIIGHGEHGKDYVAERLVKDLGLKFISSSRIAGAVVFNRIKELGLTHDDDLPLDYTTEEDCFNDRRNHRALWKQLINEYNEKDKSRLARDIFKHHDVYVGLRAGDEFIAGYQANLFDIIIAVDARKRVGVADVKDLDIPLGVCDIRIDNNGTREELDRRLTRLVPLLRKITKLRTKETSLIASVTSYERILATRMAHPEFIPSEDDMLVACEWLKQHLPL